MSVCKSKDKSSSNYIIENDEKMKYKGKLDLTNAKEVTVKIIPIDSETENEHESEKLTDFIKKEISKIMKYKSNSDSNTIKLKPRNRIKLKTRNSKTNGKNTFDNCLLKLLKLDEKVKFNLSLLKWKNCPLNFTVPKNDNIYYCYFKDIFSCRCRIKFINNKKKIIGEHNQKCLEEFSKDVTLYNNNKELRYKDIISIRNNKTFHLTEKNNKIIKSNSLKNELKGYSKKLSELNFNKFKKSFLNDENIKDNKGISNTKQSKINDDNLIIGIKQHIDNKYKHDGTTTFYHSISGEPISMNNLNEYVDSEAELDQAYEFKREFQTVYDFQDICDEEKKFYCLWNDHMNKISYYDRFYYETNIYEKTLSFIKINFENINRFKLIENLSLFLFLLFDSRKINANQFKQLNDVIYSLIVNSKENNTVKNQEKS